MTNILEFTFDCQRAQEIWNWSVHLFARLVGDSDAQRPRDPDPDTGRSTQWAIPAMSELTWVEALPLQPLFHSAAGSYQHPPAASAEHASSSTFNHLHVCCLYGRVAETGRHRRFWRRCSYTCLSVFICAYLCSCLSVIQTTQEKWCDCQNYTQHFLILPTPTFL